MKILKDADLDAATKQTVAHQSVDAVKIFEPRLEAISNNLRALLEAVQLESNGQPITPSGFRLRNPGNDTSQIFDLDDRSAGVFLYNRLKGLPGFAWGQIQTDNLRFSCLKDIKREIAAAGAKSVLICSSELMQPIVDDMITASGEFNDIDLKVEVPKNDYFGGTIVLGDFLVVEDYIRFIDDWVERCGAPDLILIPSLHFSLGEWKRDLNGRPFSDIERCTDCRVVCLEIKPMAG